MNNELKRTINNLTLTVLAIASLTCLISLMALFVGGGQSGTDLRAIMYLQAGLTPIALAIAVFGIARFISGEGWRSGTRTMWQALPQWLVFMFLLLNSLVLFGEIAFVIVMRATEQRVLWHEHVPLLCMLACTCAYLVTHARANSYPGSPPAMSGRWTQ